MVITLGIMVVLGIMGGGMVALAMLSPRHTQNIYGILALAGVVLGLLAAIVDTLQQPNLVPAILSSLLSLILSVFIGYAITTFFVLAYNTSSGMEPPDPRASRDSSANKPAVIYFAPGESPRYDARVAARSFETHDYPQTLPPTLFRPLLLLDLKNRYAAVETSPYRDIQMKLAQKVEDRLGKRYRSYIAFYEDEPHLSEVAVQALREGANKLIVLHARLTSPPPQLNASDLLEDLRPERYGLTIIETGSLWDSELLPRAFVRRAQAAVAEEARGDVGLLLIGAGHPRIRRATTDGADPVTSLQRQNQETSFQKRVRQALIKGGFNEERVVIGWLRWQEPTLEAALQQLIDAGCKRIYWLGTGILAEGLLTLNEIPTRLGRVTLSPGGEISSLGAWNDDDIVADALAEKAKQALAEVPD